MSAKDLVVRAITSQEAGRVVRSVHYSGKIVQNSTLHLGVFMAGNLCGAMQFGSPLDRRKVLPLVRGTEWNQMLELNRMAFDERLPRNAESRALGVAFRMLRKHRPDIKWILSFSDATQCGDGVIYRASGFVLTAVNENRGLYRMPNGEACSVVTFSDGLKGGGETKRRHGYVEGEGASRFMRRVGAKVLPGYQLRYIRFLDPAWVDRLTVPVIPFDQIPPEARMYRGVRGGPQGTHGDHPREDGVSPIPPLHGARDA
jgi:hypothetical protein